VIGDKIPLEINKTLKSSINTKAISPHFAHAANRVSRAALAFDKGTMNHKRISSWFLPFVLAAVSAVSFQASGSDATRELPTSQAETSVAVSDPPNDFSVHLQIAGGESRKFITFGWRGFAGGVVRWRYDDTNRSLGTVSPSAASALNTIQTAMTQWSQVCNVTFVYDGTSTLGPSAAPPSNSLDGVNVIGWRNQSGQQTGVTGVGATGPSAAGPFTLNEADIAFNYAYDPIFAQTALHEIGHLIGIDHSDVNNVVMSGPPTSVYGNQAVLQADDIAGCVALYGAPTATAATISGTIPGGAASANITFCARPAAGVTCSPSTSTGAYSCTVPAGWTGVLHAAAPVGKRIRQQSFSNVTTALSAQNPLLQNVGSCELDVDNNGLFEPDIDGLAILRRMAGFNVSAFSGLSGTCAGNTTSAAVYAATASNYNVTGGAVPRPTTDGLLITRAMRKLTGTAVTQGATSQSWATVQSWLNSNCGSSF
jgi:Matrixin